MMRQETHTCQNCKTAFTIEPEDFAFYEKMKVPPPTFCPECRMVRRMLWRNEQAMYRRKDATGKTVISIFAPEKSYVVHEHDYWWSDKWDAMDYGRDYDFSKPFFEQFTELLRRVPLMALQNWEAVNSEYCTNTSRCKDCYLVTAGFADEKVLYTNRALLCKDSLDLHLCEKLELSYESVNCTESFQLFFSKDSENCSSSYFLQGCKNCSNCFGCVNLNNKSYYILNQPYTKGAYEEKLQELGLGSFKELKNAARRFREHQLNFPYRFAKIISSQNVSGDNIRGSKGCFSCFNVFSDAEDSKFVEWAGYGLKDTYDIEGSGDNCSLLYENLMTERISHALFTISTTDSSETYFSFNCYSSHNLFACIGLRNKQYCILNKQYTKEEYESLVPKIIEHMNTMPYTDAHGRVYRYGEFFPPELSPFAYNETIAQEYFPLTKEQAAAKGYSWRDPEAKNYVITLHSQDLPDHIKDADDRILNQTIGCQHQATCIHQCTTAFKIIPQELEFYRNQNIPLPRLCPHCRHGERISQRNPMKLWHRSCQCAGVQSENSVYQNQIPHFHNQDHCPHEFETSYAPEREEIVYCEECYQQEVG